MNADPGRREVSSDFRNLSFSTSADVTRFSLEPLVDTVNAWSSRTLRPDSLMMRSIAPMSGSDAMPSRPPRSDIKVRYPATAS